MKKSTLCRLCAIAAVTLCALGAEAQVALYGAFSTAKVSGVSRLYGGTVGGYYDSRHFVVASLGLDARYSFTGNSGTKFNSLALGPRIAVHPHVLPFSPYVEVTGGLGRLSFSGAGSQTKFEYQFLGGLDWTILPRIDWRAVEFSYGGLAGLSGSSFHPKTLSTGLVLRLP